MASLQSCTESQAFMHPIETPRLLLRLWRPSDRDPFYRLNADPRVREFFPSCLTRTESDAMVDLVEAHFALHGFGFWAAELKNTDDFIGFVGLGVPDFEGRFTPCIEIGWRLAAAFWNRGLATEGARATLRYAFDVLALREVVGFTVPANLRSRRVMEKLGMTHDPDDDFDHPRIPEGHPLRRHVLYRIRKNVLDPDVRSGPRMVQEGGSG